MMPQGKRKIAWNLRLSREERAMLAWFRRGIFSHRPVMKNKKKKQ